MSTLQALSRAAAYQVMGYFRMVFHNGRWTGKWIVMENSFTGLTDFEKDVLEDFCEWLNTHFDAGLDYNLIEFAHTRGVWSGSGRYVVNLDIDEDSYAAVEYYDGDSDYPVCIRLYRKMAV